MDYATYYSPIENHKHILERAKELDELLMQSFQLFMSSMSVQDSHESIRKAHESIQQTRRAIMVTVLAFIYVPLTLVATGIFGINISQASNGFLWWAPLVAFVAVAVFTIPLYLIATRLLECRSSRRSSLSGREKEA